MKSKTNILLLIALPLFQSACVINVESEPDDMEVTLLCENTINDDDDRGVVIMYSVEDSYGNIIAKHNNRIHFPKWEKTILVKKGHFISLTIFREGYDKELTMTSKIVNNKTNEILAQDSCDSPESCWADAYWQYL